MPINKNSATAFESLNMYIIIRHRGKEYKTQEVDFDEAQLQNFIEEFPKQLNKGFPYTQKLSNGHILLLTPLAAQEATYEFVTTKPAKVRELT